MSHKNVYTVNGRLAALEARCIALEKENSALHTQVQHFVSTPGATGRDGARGLKGDAGRDGRNGFDGKDAVGIQGATGLQGPRGIRGERGEKGEQGIQGLPGKDGVSITGPAGPQGPRGDVTVVGDIELQEAVQVLRRKHAKFLGALQHARELNAQQPSEALRRALDSVLRTIEKESQ